MTVERLYTPWRMKYVAKTKKPKSNCVFCDYVEMEPFYDSENFLVYRGEQTFIMMNIYPYNPGHLMVLPNDHVAALSDVSGSIHCEMMQMASYYTELLGHLMNPDGFNVGLNIGKAAGAGIDAHLHLHVVPRWNGDSNFMPVTGNTRVLPEELSDTYRKLIDAMQQMPPPR